MDKGDRSCAAPRIEVGSIFCSPQELRAAVSKRFLEDGRGFKAGIGGGRQKEYVCSGGRSLPKRVKKKETKPGDPPEILVEPGVVLPVGPFCPAKVRATMSSVGEWRVSHADFEHVNCSGGDARARLCGINPLVTRTVSANPEIGAKALKKSLEQETGVPVSMRTAARARSNILTAGTSEIKESYHDLPSYFKAFVEDSPGSVALVEVRCMTWQQLTWQQLPKLYKCG